MAEMCQSLYRRAVVDDELPGDALFQVLDYEGVEVRCSHEHWTSKIARDHPDVARREQDVADAIERPAMVLQDRDHAGRKHHMTRTPAGQWLKVVVDYESDPRSGREQGSVLTAFLHRRLRTGDTALYIRNKD